MIVVRVKYKGYTHISEYVMGNRDDLYNLIEIMSLTTFVKAFQVFVHGKQITDLSTDFGFNNSLSVDAFISGDFTW